MLLNIHDRSPLHLDIKRSQIHIMDNISATVIKNNGAEAKETVVSSVDADKPKTEFVWTLQATWHLVHTRLDMDPDFDQPVCKKKKLWEVVAQKVNVKLRESELSHVNVKAYECDLKWRNMLATYRKNAQRATRVGTTAAVHWEFFKAMHQVLGRSRGEEEEEEEQEGETRYRTKLSHTRLGTAVAKRFTPILPSPAPTPTTRPAQDVLQLYVELMERKMKMWEQQKELEERKIQAINNLAEAISSLAQKDRTLNTM